MTTCAGPWASDQEDGQSRAQVMVYKYDEEEWANVVPKDTDWSRKETDYLLGLCQQFDLRFLVVADRYEVRC